MAGGSPGLVGGRLAGGSGGQVCGGQVGSRRALGGGRRRVDGRCLAGGGRSAATARRAARRLFGGRSGGGRACGGDDGGSAALIRQWRRRRLTQRRGTPLRQPSGPKPRAAAPGWPGAAICHISNKLAAFFRAHPPGKTSSPRGVAHLRAAGEENFEKPPDCGFHERSGPWRAHLHLPCGPARSARAAQAARAAAS